MYINFRIANNSDLIEISAMMEDFYAIDNYPFEQETTEKNILEFINNHHLGRLWLILDEDKVIGYITLTFGFSFEYKGRDAFLDEIFIKENYRNKGIGSTTLDFTYKQAEVLEIKAIHLEVEKHNKKGNKLYQKKGFSGNENRILMTKRIS